MKHSDFTIEKRGSWKGKNKKTKKETEGHWYVVKDKDDFICGAFPSVAQAKKAIPLIMYNINKGKVNI